MLADSVGVGSGDDAGCGHVVGTGIGVCGSMVDAVGKLLAVALEQQQAECKLALEPSSWPLVAVAGSLVVVGGIAALVAGSLALVPAPAPAPALELALALEGAQWGLVVVAHTAALLSRQAPVERTQSPCKSLV